MTENELANLALKIEQFACALSEREQAVVRALFYALSDPEVRIGMRDAAELFTSEEMEKLERMGFWR